MADAKQLLEEIFSSYPLRVRARSGKLITQRTPRPGTVEIDAVENGLTVRSKDWSLSLPGVAAASLSRTGSARGPLVSFLDERDRVMFQVNLRRPSEEQVAAFSNVLMQFDGTRYDAAPIAENSRQHEEPLA
jgi:hypothetical protein